MATRMNQKKENKRHSEKPGTPVHPNTETLKKGKKIKEDIDKLVDDIDSVLEENAEEFVKNYVQKGGQ